MKYTFSVCEGRHEMPCKEAIFCKDVQNIFDFGGLYEVANKAIPQNCGLLDLYVTGLTPCVLAVVAVCHDRGIALTCLHYNREDNKYYPQIVF